MRINPLLRLPIWLYLIFSMVVLTNSCGRQDLPDPYKEIISCILKRADGSSFTASELTILIKDHRIDITVPANTDLTRLVPEFEIKGKSISPASGLLQDFSQPIIYTVIAEDGSSEKYTVTITKRLSGITVYIGSSDKNFYAIDGNTGILRWKYTSIAGFDYSSGTYANGRVYVGGIDNFVYCFDAITGSIYWRYQAGTTGIESDAVMVDGTVYVGSNDDYLYAIDAATGMLKWKYLTGGNVSASPVITDGVVYFGSSDGKLYALYTTTGELKWSFATGGMINQSGPALVDGVIYVGSRDGYLYAIHASSGAQKWRFSANGISLEQSSPTVANGIVYIGSWYNISDFTKKGSLFAVNVNTGGLVWEKLTNTGISSSPTVVDGRLFITADDLLLHALDAATGATLWTKRILANSASPGVSNGVVYVGGGGTNNIYAFNAVNGAEKWRFPIPGGISTSSPLIVAENGVPEYAGDSGGKQ